MKLTVVCAVGVLVLAACQSGGSAPSDDGWKVSSMNMEDDFWEPTTDCEAKAKPPCAAPAPVAVAPTPRPTYAAPQAPPPPPQWSGARPMPAPTGSGGEAALRDKLNSLQRLRSQGVLTEQEYQSKRQQVINAYNP